MSNDPIYPKRWYVITPKYGVVEPVLDYGQGPTVYACDVVEIEAATRRDALLLGVKEMRRLKYSWFDDVGENPYKGMVVEEIKVREVDDGRAKQYGLRGI